MHSLALDFAATEGDPWTQQWISSVTRSLAARAAGSFDVSTIICLAFATVSEWANASPVRLVLMRATTPPTCVMPSQIATYSAQLVIIRATTHPERMSCANAQWAYWFARAARPE